MSYYTILTTFRNGDDPQFAPIVKCKNELEYLDYLIKNDPNFIEEELCSFIENIEVVSYKDRVATIDISKVSPVNYCIDAIRKQFYIDDDSVIATLTLKQMLQMLKDNYENPIDNWSSSKLIKIAEYTITNIIHEI